ncbi:hypothetical protein EMIT0P12_10392 [Pseudomonas sp. IT-P12]
MDEHSRSELDTVQKVTLISCWVNEVFMEVYLAIACWISLWRLSYPERGATEWNGGKPLAARFYGCLVGCPLRYFGGST